MDDIRYWNCYTGADLQEIHNGQFARSCNSIDVKHWEKRALISLVISTECFRLLSGVIGQNPSSVRLSPNLSRARSASKVLAQSLVKAPVVYRLLQVVCSLTPFNKTVSTTHLGKENKYMSTKSFDQLNEKLLRAILLIFTIAILEKFEKTSRSVEIHQRWQEQKSVLVWLELALNRQ